MENTNKRSGNTSVTSVSVSEEFRKLIEQYDLSPTECFRRGVAVTLFDLGVGMYQSPKNEQRFKFMEEFLRKLDEDEKLKKEYEQIKLFTLIKGNLSSIKKLIKEIEDSE